MSRHVSRPSAKADIVRGGGGRKGLTFEPGVGANRGAGVGGKQERQCEWHCRVIQETPFMSVYHGGVSIESLCIGSSFRPGHTMPWLLGVGPRHVRFAGCTAAAIDGSVFDVSAWSPRDATPKTVWLMTLGRLMESCLVCADRAHRCTSPPLESA